MEVPTPNTIQWVWTYLHERAHLRLHGRLLAEGNNYSRGEAEAELEVLRILDEEQITIPLGVLLSRSDYVLSHAREDDRNSERHPTVTECLDEFARRIKAADAWIGPSKAHEENSAASLIFRPGRNRPFGLVVLIPRV